jgi:hypothetical protein
VQKHHEEKQEEDAQKKDMQEEEQMDTEEGTQNEEKQEESEYQTEKRGNALFKWDDQLLTYFWCLVTPQKRMVTLQELALQSIAQNSAASRSLKVSSSFLGK